MAALPPRGGNECLGPTNDECQRAARRRSFLTRLWPFLPAASSSRPSVCAGGSVPPGVREAHLPRLQRLMQWSGWLSFFGPAPYLACPLGPQSMGVSDSPHLATKGTPQPQTYEARGERDSCPNCAWSDPSLLGLSGSWSRCGSKRRPPDGGAKVGHRDRHKQDRLQRCPSWRPAN